jgi:prepilin-type processing-associated H-X9-DG protein
MGSWVINPNNPNCWVDPLAGWHNDRNTLGFADGHAEKHRWRSENTIKMNLEQRHGYCPSSTPNDLDDDADLFYMLQAYEYRKLK